ncbi:hypothetical protein PV11_00177 [Exophiala sideris]|uniref:N-acetyltransferase domain-containing protein n=1 Tax=Exophiala sideris TaxID=1016849 RepID=A0A0D1YSH1_9EURO|nr:hypothetical protein PV11_00177 [Exophiala sideris]
MSSSISAQAPSYKVISPESSTDLNNFIDIITEAFASTALTTSFIVDNDKTPPPYPSPSIDVNRRQRHFAQGILDSAHSNAELVQAGDWSAIALWEPPSFQGKAFIDSKARPGVLLSEWRGRVKAAKSKHLAMHSNSSTDSESNSTSDSDNNEPQLRPFYHLSFLARNPSVPRVAGSINAVMLPFLQRAQAEHVPAWLEATTPQAVKVYEHFGFRVVEEIVIGKGRLDAQGWPSVDGKGEGVTAWAMIYDPHLKD